MPDEIQEIALGDANYPKLLAHISNPPKTLYARGDMRHEESCVAVVGTRSCSPYGKHLALTIAGDLADAGLTVVSGLAPGIDTCAHQAAARRKKRTIAVLGTGIDEKSIYPQENIALSRDILLHGGALVSEYPPGTNGSRFTFPRRNRIVSGLSLGVLVVEAKEKSGSLITARWAIAQKRKLFATPGSVLSPTSRGAHLAIKQLGALLVENANDILQKLNISAIEQPLSAGAGTREEQKILAALEHDILVIDEIIDRTGLAAPLVLSALAMLELKNVVQNLGQNTYAITHR